MDNKDFDGDACSVIVAYSEEAIEEVKNKLNSRSFYVNTSGKISFSLATDTVDYLVQNLTGEPNGIIDGGGTGTESYQEGPSSTVTHQKKEYQIDKILTLVKSEPIIQIEVNKLNWILKYGTPDPARMEKADYKYPLLVTEENGKYFVIDGFHRLAKANREGVKKLPCKIVSLSNLQEAEID